jgi:hypothetical protein
VFLKEAKHFYREDAKTAKRQKGRSKRFATEGHGNKAAEAEALPRNYTEKHGKDRSRDTEGRHIFQSRMRKRR